MTVVGRNRKNIKRYNGEEDVEDRDHLRPEGTTQIKKKMFHGCQLKQSKVICSAI